VANAGERRSERVLLDIPVVLFGETADHGPFREETFTVTVSAHGALLMLETRVAIGQKVKLANPGNWDEQEARVAFVGGDHAGLAAVGIEFEQPAPQFWPVSSPPLNWKTC
jgi:PilZ domain-containing protein